ncbi:MAG: cation-translocating P-type ATPase [Coprobacillaceae bacterium]
MNAYQRTYQEVEKELGINAEGLSHEEANKRQLTYGKNEIIAEKPKSPIVIFLEQFKDILVIILIIAAIISAISGELESTLVILFVITINSILGTVQTVKAQKSLDSLKALSTPKAKVKRGGELHEVDASQITVGDIVVIEAGDVIVGDGRLRETNQLQINESALTGESNSIDKHTDPITKECVIGDMTNMVFSSGLVTNGTGQYIVTDIGMNTQIGKIATMLNTTKERKTPLQKSLDSFSVKLSLGIMIICAVVLVMNVLLAGENILDALMIAVALAVAAIPEALGSIVTIVLSISTQKMAKEHAIIKNLNSVESLGCVSVICSDKTGTLTQNKMTAMNVYVNQGLLKINQINHYNHCHDVLLKSCALCNNAVIKDNQEIGDPTEIALLDMYKTYNVTNDAFSLIASRQLELPFDSDRKLMSITSKNHLYTKGATDELLKRCKTILIDDQKIPLEQKHINQILDQNHRFASEGLRVLGFAYKTFDKHTIHFEDEKDLTFVGMVSLMDPPREESFDAVRDCRIAGIKPIMITGDHVITATSIAKQIGIYKDGDTCLEGAQLETMSDEELDAKLSNISVYARVAPEHKIRIVQAWQKRGEIVAMTGDGVNDAPALKQSDIGVAMGITGSEVSKDAASMILTDDNFSTIVKAIITGRNVYTNIKNAITYLLSGNFAAIICVLITSFAILPTPFFPVHLLFINLITDSLPAIAIGMEQGSDNILHQQPRKSNDSILNKETVSKIAFEGIVICIFTMLSYFIGYRVDALTASTMAFGTLCLARLFHGFNSRSSLPLHKIYVNIYSVGAFFIGALLLIAILTVPAFHSLFSISYLSIQQLLMIFVFAALPSVIIQAYKTITSR